MIKVRNEIKHTFFFPLSNIWLSFDLPSQISLQTSLIKDHVPSVNEMNTREKTGSYMPVLEQLQVKGWDSLDVIFQLEQAQHSSASLNCIVKLMPVLTSPVAITGFNNLTLLSLDACHRLKYLFSHSITKHLVKLQEVKISNCKNVEKLIKIEEDSSVLLPRSTSLKAVDNESPSQVTSISQESCVLEFPSLKKISIIKCSMLEVIIGNREWTTDMTTFTFDQVQSLTLSHLPNLVSFCCQPCITEQPLSEECRANSHHKQDEVTNS